MIYDRTNADIERVEGILEKMRDAEEITAEEEAALERGTLTIKTLNRIEEKTAELHQRLHDEGYYSPQIIVKSWSYTDIFDAENFDRILSNIDTLRQSYYVYAGTPDTPRPVYHFENINSIEKILADVEELITDMISNYPECGDIECGEEI